MRQYWQGVLTFKTNRVWMKRNKPLDGIRFNESARSFAIRHTMTNSISCCSNNTGTEQQQQRQQDSICMNTCQVYYTSYSSITPGIMYQVLEVPGCETTRRQRKRGDKKTAHHKTKREHAGNRTTIQRCSRGWTYPFTHSDSYMTYIRLICIYRYE